MYPSEGTVQVVHSAERCLRQSGSVTSSANKHSLALVNYHVRRDIGGKDIFNLSDHALETQDGIDNHHFSLITLLVTIFYNLRMFHFAKLHTQELQRGNQRKKLCKTILFQGH